MSNLTISLDDRTKKRFNRFCADVGLSASSVITVYINTVLRENRIPFIIEGSPRPNAETLAAIDDLDNNRNLSRYDSVDALMKDVL